MRPWLVALPLLLACRQEGELLLEPADVELEVFTPTYGEFLGDAAAVVTGRVFPVTAAVTVDGLEATVGPEGRFELELPVDHAYRVLDVEASLGDDSERVRVPVFRGQDPLLAWPGGVTLRLTPGGLDRLGEELGALVDDLGWEQMLLDAVPGIQTANFSLAAVGVTHAPTVVAMKPADGELKLAVTLSDVALELEVQVNLGGGPTILPATIGYEEIALGFSAVPKVDADGLLTLELLDGDIVLDTPEVTLAGLDGWLLELVMAGLGLLIQPLGEGLIDQILAQAGVLELGGPLAFSTELLGTSVDVRLSDLFTDPAGVGAGLAVGLGQPAVDGPLGLPAPVDGRPEVHAALGLHEGLLQLLVTGGLLDLLTQDFELPGALGEIIGTGVRALPGGDDAPEGDGWCLKLDPGSARAARMSEGVEPLASIYLPDVLVDIGVMDGGSCDPWLTSSLAFEVGLDVRGGTKISMGLTMPEGAVLAYGTSEDWEENEVVEGLTGFLGGAISLLAGQFTIDLADLAGGQGAGTGVLGELQPRVLDAVPMVDAGGTPIEGLYGVSLALWP